jgi:hypothetical protein
MMKRSVQMTASPTRTAVDVNNDVVTVVIDPKNSLGKRFNSDGSKSANVQVSMALATQRHVPTATAMAAVIKEVSENPNAAIINACFPAVPINETFLIFSEHRFHAEFGFTERAQMQGVHTYKIGKQDYNVV